MHTIIVIGIGFGVLGLCALAGRTFGGSSGIAMAILAFLPMWLIGAAIKHVHRSHASWI